MLRFAFYGRVPADQQNPGASRNWQVTRAGSRR
jgi:hypothetical protein